MEKVAMCDLFFKGINPEQKSKVLKSALEIISRKWEGKTHINKGFMNRRFLLGAVASRVLSKVRHGASKELSDFAFVVNTLMGIGDTPKPGNRFQVAFKEWVESVKDISSTDQK